MKLNPRVLAALGALIVAPSFVINVIAHDGVMPGPDEVDRVDGAFSIMFMVGAALVVAALIAVRPSPVGRKGRYLLYAEAVMVVLGGIWAAHVAVDPDLAENYANPLIFLGDASWPLHQAFMLVTGIVAVRAKLWPSPARFTLFGPVFGLAFLGVGAATGIDYLAAAALGSGWVFPAIGVIAVTSNERTSFATPGTAVTAAS